MPNRRAVRRARDLRDEAIDIAVLSALSATWNRIRGEALDYYAQLRRSGITDTATLAADVRTHLGALSTQPEATLARESSTVAYGEGRNAAIVAAAESDGLDFAMYTAVNDRNTCENCYDLDGTVYVIGSPEFYANKPMARCKGGELCRCEYVALAPETIQ